LIDGTLFPLAFAPTVNGEDYYTRKLIMLLKGWSFVMMLRGLCGSKWGGWVVFTSLWSNSEIYLGLDKHFDHKEYLLGDSVFSTSEVMIPAYKKGHNSSRVRKSDSLIPSLQRLKSRVSTA